MACLHCITIFWMMVAAPILAKNYTVKFEVWYFKQFFLNHIIMIKNMLHIFLVYIATTFIFCTLTIIQWTIKHQRQSPKRNTFTQIQKAT